MKNKASKVLLGNFLKSKQAYNLKFIVLHFNFLGQKRKRKTDTKAKEQGKIHSFDSFRRQA